MTAAKPKNMKEALNLIELQQSKINHLQTENDEFRDKIEHLKNRNDSLELLVHNMNEMLTKGRRMMFGRSSEQLRYVEAVSNCHFLMKLKLKLTQRHRSPKRIYLYRHILAKPREQRKNLQRLCRIRKS